MRIDAETSEYVALGVIFGGALLFGHAIWPAIVDPEKRDLPSRRAIRRAEKRMSTGEALAAAAITYGALFVVIDFNIQVGRSLYEKGELPEDFF